MSDWIGLVFILIMAAGAYIGIRQLSKQRTSTEDEFEERAAESSTLLGAGANAISGMLNPGAAKGKEAVTQLKRGDYQKKRDAGKAQGQEGEEE